MSKLLVLDLCRDLAGSYCGRLFAGMGETVVKVEPPGGDPLRRQPPFAAGSPSPGTGALFLHLNAGKRSVVLDIESADGRDLLLRLVERADLVIESFAPGWMEAVGLGYERLREANHRLVLTSITPFGQDGPYRDFRTTEIGLRAVSGEMYLAGQPQQPLKKAGNIGQYLGGINGFIGSMGALFRREQTGEGVHVDVSLVESLTSIVGQALREQAATGIIPGRRQGGLGWPNNIYPCADGYVMTFTAYAVGDAWWPPFAAMITAGTGIETPASPPREPQVLGEWDARFRDWLAARTRREIYIEAQGRGLAFGYLATAPDLLTSPQLGHRRFFARVQHPEVGECTLMHLPFLVDGERYPIAPAPVLGSDGRELFQELLGLLLPETAGLQPAEVD